MGCGIRLEMEGLERWEMVDGSIDGLLIERNNGCIGRGSDGGNGCTGSWGRGYRAGG